MWESSDYHRNNLSPRSRALREAQVIRMLIKIMRRQYSTQLKENDRNSTSHTEIYFKMCRHTE